MSVILLSEGSESAPELAGIAYTETLGTVAMQSSALSLGTSLTETYGWVSAVSVGTNPGLYQLSVTQG